MQRRKLQVVPIKPVVIEIDKRTKPSTVKLVRAIAKALLKNRESVSIQELYSVSRVTLGMKLKSEYVISSLISQKYLIDCETRTIWKASKD